MSQAENLEVMGRFAEAMARDDQEAVDAAPSPAARYFVADVAGER
jgi:hypothetical protein